MYNETCEKCRRPGHEYLIAGMCFDCAEKELEELERLRAAVPTRDDLIRAATKIDNMANVEHQRFGAAHAIEILADRGLASRLFAAAEAAGGDS